MSITNSYKHTFDDGFEQYAFESNLDPKQKHYIDREGFDDPWVLCLVQLEETLTPEQVQELRVELTELYAFMQGLNQRELCRRTEPGAPSFEEGI